MQLNPPHKSLSIPVGLTLVLGAAALLSCKAAPPERQAPRLVLLYATCTVNKSYLSPYNTSITFTPNLQRFASEARVFERHTTEAGQSGIAFASIFTGTQAHRHGVYRHPMKLTDDQYLISEAFADNGYETFFWNGHPMASRRLNFGQGVTAENTFKYLLEADDPKFIEILERLRTDESYKAFILTNFTVTHSYKMDFLETFRRLFPSEFEGITAAEMSKYAKLFQRNRQDLRWNFPEAAQGLELQSADIEKLARAVELLYKSRVNFLDRHFGAVVNQVERHQALDDSLIAFTADHGEMLYREHSHVKWEHGLALLPDVLHVPLMIRSPLLGLEGKSWSGVTRSIDVFPTMLGLSGIEMPAEHEVEGVDLSPALSGGQEAPELVAYSHTTVPIERLLEVSKKWTLKSMLFPTDDVEVIWTAARDGDDFYRLRHLGDDEWRFEAYDLAGDPAAVQNVFTTENPEHREMARKLTAYKSLLVDNYGVDPEKRPSRREETRLLRSLGYLE